MKRFGTIATTLLVLVALTQCKKEEQPTPANGSEAVTITLDLKSNGGTRVDVNTTTGEVTYQNGDVIYVASGGHYIGTLTYNGTNFTGGITDPIVGEPLHFYFLGNVVPAETLAAGTTTTCSVVITDQTEHLPVIEYAPSNENYDSGATTYTAMLLNKCALVKFNVTTVSEAATCITGMKNKVTVDFSENTLTHGQEGNGIITLPAGSGEKWTILLPQEAVEAGEDGTAYSEDGTFTGTRGAVPAITENGYQTAGIEVSVTTEGGTPGGHPVGAINGLFTINASGDQVYFSQGNLQYIGSAAMPYWKFADNQWDVLGTTTGQNSSSQNVDRDLFGWGTSGWNNENTYYQPWNTAMTEESNYGQLYGPPDSYNLTGSYANADWGVYNAIANGGNIPNLWRTLTYTEWDYVFNSRNTPSGIRYAKGIVNGVNGVILLPNNWGASVYALNYTNMSNAPYNTNEITAENWDTMESNGAVFLPAAGNRYGTSVTNVGSYGYYWSASYYNSNYAWFVYFNDSNLYTSSLNLRDSGFSVRLARVAEN